MSPAGLNLDLLIIGGGTAGLSALREALKHTLNVRLINDGPIRTTCIQAGCMPSKSMLHIAKSYAARRHFARLGILEEETLRLDGARAFEHVRRLREHFLASLRQSLEPLKPYILDGKASFAEPTRVLFGENSAVAKRIVIATGSSPIVPAAFHKLGDKAITSDALFDLETLPRRVGVIGLGPLGLEAAQALAMMECDVIGVHDQALIGGLKDSDMSGMLVEMLKRQFRECWIDTAVTPFVESDSVVLKASDGRMAPVDLVVLATGRQPNLGALGLRDIGVTMEKGLPEVDANFRIKGFPIFLVGDARGKNSVLHVAAEEGRRAAYFSCGGGRDPGPMPVRLNIAFTQPNIAFVGDIGEGTRDPRWVYGEAAFANQGRAVIEDANAGMLRVFVDPATRCLQGAEILAPEGEHHAHLFALAIQRKLTVDQMLEMPFYHPTTEEGVRTALRDALSKLNERSKAEPRAAFADRDVQC